MRRPGAFMTGRNTAGRILVTIGAVILLASAALHFFGGYHAGFPALASSNLDPGLQAAFRVVFLAVGWHWILLSTMALVAAFSGIALRKFVVLVCGVGVLIEAAAGAAAMGFFVGNEMIGLAAILMTMGGLLFERVAPRDAR